jgi:hypothetical protein
VSGRVAFKGCVRGSHPYRGHPRVRGLSDRTPRGAERTRSTFDQPAPPQPRRIEEIRDGEVGHRVAVSRQAPRQTMTPPNRARLATPASYRDKPKGVRAPDPQSGRPGGYEYRGERSKRFRPASARFQGYPSRS